MDWLKMLGRYLKEAVREAKEAHEMISGWAFLVIALVLYCARKANLNIGDIDGVWSGWAEALAWAWSAFVFVVWLPARLLKEKDKEIAELEGKIAPLEFLESSNMSLRHGYQICAVRLQNNSLDKSATELKVEVVKAIPGDAWADSLFPLQLRTYPEGEKSINPSASVIIDLFEAQIIQNHHGGGKMTLEIGPMFISGDRSRPRNYYATHNFKMGEEFSLFVRATASDFKSTTQELVLSFTEFEKNNVQFRIKVKQP